MPAQILQGNVTDLLPTLKPGSVDAVVTSPPYWMLRSYLPKGHPLKPLELGSEPTPAEFVANLVRVFRLVREAMADHAVAFVNIGDSYSGGGGGNYGTGKNAKHSDGATYVTNVLNRGGFGIPAGNLCLIPQRLQIALQDDGWIVRSVIVWHKPNPMPASLAGWAWRRCRVKVKGNTNHDTGKNGQHNNPTVVGFNARWDDPANHAAQWTDCPGCQKCEPHGGYVLRRGSWRPTSAWEPILMLAKTGRYFSDGEPVKTPLSQVSLEQIAYFATHGESLEVAGKGLVSEGQAGMGHKNGRGDKEGRLAQQGSGSRGAAMNSSGANARDVQSWSAEPLSEKHYASFPTALVRFCLLCGTSAKGYCPTCGAPWCRVVDKPFVGSYHNHNAVGVEYGLRQGGCGPAATYDAGKTIGWRPSCSCSPVQEPRPGLVCDPFAGSGRTGLTAARMGLDFVGCELSPEYASMARRLLHEDAPLFQRNGHAD